MCGFTRTPHGKFMGALKDFSAAELGGIAIKKLLQKYEIPREEVNGVFMGEVLTAGEGQAPARRAAILGGLPESCPAETFNKVCSSSLVALHHATNMIRVGEVNLMISGGMESMSRSPYLLRRVSAKPGDQNLATLYEEATSLRDAESVLAYDSMFYDGLTEPSRMDRPNMAMLSDLCAVDKNIPRDDLDQYAYLSCARASMTDLEDRMAEHIVPITLSDGTELTRDETLRGPELEKMKNMAPLPKCTRVTLAAMSQLADGASALLIASDDAIRRLHLVPLARIVDFATFSHDLEWYTTAPVPAIGRLLLKNELDISDIGFFEVNEASAVVPIYTAKELRIPRGRLNIWGGSIAIGHPLGATSARITGTLAVQIQKHALRYGIATTCNGGGEAVAVLLERV
ncbi:hypothetical protein A2673_01160 [Candidatus Kaiserbacteria bacterium RIFCSPHIGHO2_01_FULL_50_13]|uniref:Acetyl-CoA acetyltransferase n=1 Tax=Candidatus Kaiserbacteria bacterium RIFCSPLOWO2_01_FULL_50_24 TaxID=1798507 RepID=A0A1F6ENB4_9BACT|nr:MAG: hypothetical protein A2673_01160 [Candidatus Kaiserbacteria bacterium RIFCSPHIGHO2_01_FULL_50_13]OGG75111.1 MAG: hypothetical protein A3A34_02010 [Candidatus Kaiserbacteria bacterium RIFCSPLOWO2_01_FULL_50_24]